MSISPLSNKSILSLNRLEGALGGSKEDGWLVAKNSSISATAHFYEKTDKLQVPGWDLRVVATDGGINMMNTYNIPTLDVYKTVWTDEKDMVPKWGRFRITQELQSF